MANSNYDDAEVTELDNDLLEEFSKELEKLVNKLCQEKDSDPRLELLVSLGLVASQLAIDVGFDQEEFSQLINDLYHDCSEPEEEEKLETPQKRSKKPIDKKMLN